MFMTDYEQVYGKVTRTSNNNDVIPQAREQTQTSEEKGKALETAAKAAKVVVDAHVAAAKFAGGAVSKLSKKAVEYAKSDEAAEKLDMAKDKAGAAFSVMKNKVSSFAAEPKRSTDESNLTVTDEDINAAEDDAYAYYDKEISQESVEGATDDISSVKPNNNITPDNSVKSFTETENSQNYSSASSETETVPQPTNVVSSDTKLDYSPRNYSYEEEKKSPIIYVLIIVIAVLLVGVGILGGILIMENKKADDKEITISEFSDEEIKNNETTSSEKIATTKDTQNVKANATESTTESPKENNSTERIDTSDAAKKAIYNHLDEQLSEEKTNKFHYFDRDLKYAMYDVNNDSIDELFITYENQVSTISDLYIFKNSEYVKSYCLTNAKICLSDHLLREESYEGDEVTNIYVLLNNKLLNKDEFCVSHGWSNNEYYHNNLNISESEYNRLYSEYETKDWIDLYYSENVSELIDISAYAQNNNISSDSYNNECCYENGFTFFDYVEHVKSFLTEYQILQEYDELSVSNEMQHIVHYQYPSQGNNDIILGLCFVDDKLIGVNWGIWNNSYSVSDMYNIIKKNIISQYGEPDDCSDVTASWYVDPFGPGTFYWLYNFGDGVQISYFANYDAEYEKTSLLPIDLSSVPFIIDDVTNKYTTYDTSAAGPGFSFNNDSYERKVVTENDSLNLRASPSTSSDIITQMPKGSKVSVWGTNGEWYYISYNENGITYYGYASSEFIGLP